MSNFEKPFTEARNKALRTSISSHIRNGDDPKTCREMALNMDRLYGTDYFQRYHKKSQEQENNGK